MTRPLRYAIACGGTGGHLFPGLAVAEELLSRGHEVLLFVSEKEVDTRALQAHPHIRYERLPSVALPSIVSPAMIGFLRRLRRSLSRCSAIYADFRPDGVLGMGGFTSTAPLLAARLRRVPVYVHDSNSIPGKANLFAARFATAVFLGFADCAKYFPKVPVKVTGTPIRRELMQRIEASEARRQLGLDPSAPTLLVMGGSQGAAGINALMIRALPSLAWTGGQVVHLAGDRDGAALREAYAAAGLRAEVLPFCDRMDLAYGAADLVVSRSGAASLSEISHFRLPSVLVPYPYAAEDHQRVNASIFTRAGAARLVEESSATGEALARVLQEFLSSAEARVIAGRAAGGLAPENAAAEVAKAMTGGGA